MRVNMRDPMLWEHLGMIIDEYETQALKSNTRESLLALGNAPLSGMQGVLKSSRKTLENVRDKRQPTEAGDVPEEQELDADIQEIFGGDESAVANYVKECLGCDFRLKFDWQMKPINLLGGIQTLLTQIKGAIEMFKDQLDPMKNIGGICNLLNNLKGLCLPDIITCLLSLKMLMKKYSANQFKFKLDWTVILGPILKAVVEGIAMMVDGAASVMMAPLTCVMTNIRTAQTLDIAVQGVLHNGFSSESSASSSPKGFDITANTRLEEAMIQPAFSKAPLIQKMQLGIQEAHRYMSDLVRQITHALRSVQSMVGNGLTASLGNLGFMLYIMDLVGILMVVIRMMREHKNVTDWCSLLEQKPEILENALKARYAADVRVQSEGEGLLSVYQGPKLISEIRTCASSRSASEKQLVDQWIQELQQRGA